MPDGVLRANQNQATTQEAYGELGCEGTIKLLLLPFHPVTAKRSMIIFNTCRKGLLHIASRTYLQEVSSARDANFFHSTFWFCPFCKIVSTIILKISKMLT